MLMLRDSITIGIAVAIGIEIDVHASRFNHNRKKPSQIKAVKPSQIKTSRFNRNRWAPMADTRAPMADTKKPGILPPPFSVQSHYSKIAKLKQPVPLHQFRSRL
ncbi:hypothetical protein L1887_35722 [Cichorium endivia]|nr:hypothetical protein L1887_35722 [Cichorium endivia]